MRVTAHQYWWEIVYDDPRPDRVFTTANELYVPVGRTVVATLYADDVIHSFWVPNLHGKKDLIPGRVSTIRFRADREGTYIGRCAEYCGLQHAYMAFDVVAVAPDRFAAWSGRAAPVRARARRRRSPSAGARCSSAAAACCATRSRAPPPARARHRTSRTSPAARVLPRVVWPNTPEALAAWIVDPQRIKPGVNMPSHLLSGDDLVALVAYLETLK